MIKITSKDLANSSDLMSIVQEQVNQGYLELQSLLPKDAQLECILSNVEDNFVCKLVMLSKFPTLIVEAYSQDIKLAITEAVVALQYKLKTRFKYVLTPEEIDIQRQRDIKQDLFFKRSKNIDHQINQLRNLMSSIEQDYLNFNEIYQELCTLENELMEQAVRFECRTIDEDSRKFGEFHSQILALQKALTPYFKKFHLSNKKFEDLILHFEISEQNGKEIFSRYSTYLSHYYNLLLDKFNTLEEFKLFLKLFAVKLEDYKKSHELGKDANLYINIEENKVDDSVDLLEKYKESIYVKARKVDGIHNEIKELDSCMRSEFYEDELSLHFSEQYKLRYKALYHHYHQRINAVHHIMESYNLMVQKVGVDFEDCLHNKDFHIDIFRVLFDKYLLILQKLFAATLEKEKLVVEFNHALELYLSRPTK